MVTEKEKEHTLIQKFFNPKSILVIGVSRNEYTFNGVILKNLLEAQYPGDIHIIHPHAEKIMGIPCYSSLKTFFVAQPLPEVVIILTHHNLLETLETLAKKKICNVLLEMDLSVGNTSTQEQYLQDQIQTLIQTYDLKIMGPSMIGLIDFQSKFTSSVIPVRSHVIQPNASQRPTDGVSFLAHSGGLAGACGWWKPDQPFPMAKIIHMGKSLGLQDHQMLDFLLQDQATRVIILYLKYITDEMIQRITRNNEKKPILFKYVGHQPDRAQQLVDAGAIQVQAYIELFEFAKVFLWCSPPPTPGVGIIGPSSGAINLLIDAMQNYNLYLAQLQDQNRQEILAKVGGSTKQTGNPVDYWPPSEFIGRQICQIYYDASKHLLQDANVGSLFLALEFFSEIEFNFNIFDKIKRTHPDKPIIAILIQAEKEGANRVIEIASQLQIPVFVNEVERGIRALQALLKYYSRHDDIQ